MDESVVRYELASLRFAEIQFRLACAVRNAVAGGTQPLHLPSDWSYGKHSVTGAEIFLTSEDAEIGASFLKRTATYMLAVQIRNALAAAFEDPKRHTRDEVRTTYQVARMIRNAFAHRPLDPIWSIDDDCRDKEFEVPGILSFSTRGLHGKRFDWRHYGGLLALFRLSQFVRKDLLGD